MLDDEFLKRLKSRGAIIRFAKSGKLHTLDARPIAESLSHDELVQIPRLTDLRQLELDGASITDEIVSRFTSLQSVKYLDLQHTQISDASLDVFSQLPKLQFLLLTGAPISKSGIDALRKRLLNARIVFLS